jgi:hypothetical protein
VDLIERVSRKAAKKREVRGGWSTDFKGLAL